MKQKTARLSLLSLSLLVLAILILFLIIYISKKRQEEDARPKTLLIVHDIDDNVMVRALNTVLTSFSSLYPKISTQLRYNSGVADPQAFANADVIISSHGTTTKNEFLSAATPWSGTLWVLAARTDYLNAAAERQKEAVAALRGGKATPEQFELLLGDAAKEGYTPIAIGNSHRWPFLLWLQLWTAAQKGPKAAETLPPPAHGDSSDPYSAFRSPYEELLRWKANGWFATSTWTLGWAKGLSLLDKGEAVFGLVSDQHLAAISPKGRSELEYLPFPRRPSDEAWSVGNATFIGVATAVKEKKSAELLVKYLSSPGVTQRLAGMVAKPFFAWKPDTGKTSLVLKDWAVSSLSPGYEAFAVEFSPK